MKFMGLTLPSLQELESASALIYRYMPPTPQYRWPLLDFAAGAEVWVKHENHTPVGAFKIRGGLVYLDALKQAQPRLRGVVSATRGNHGQSIAFAAQRSGCPVSWWCRTATAVKRMQPCGRSARN